MKVCFPTLGDAGEAARLSPHFSRAPFYTIVDTESGGVEMLANLNLRREHGPCNPLVSFEGAGVEAVVCRRLGRRAADQWREAGVPVYLTTETELDTALERFLANELDPLR